jgi:mannose-6-phosphate isomerase
MLKPEPTRIEPIFSERLWGSKSLAPLYPEKTNLAEPLGEAWLTGIDCPIATGPFAGKKLGEAWREMSAEWRGSNFSEPSEFPLLLKFIFPTDKLSIQVHPDDAYASKHEQGAGGRGKTEMWHIVSAKPGAKLLAGLKPDTTKEKFLSGLADHSLEDLFQAHLVKAGDTFFIPAGTPHTIGPNMVVFEVQEYSDLTYRVYDYGRVDSHGKARELHLEKALQVVNFDGSAVLPFRPQSPMDEFGAAYVCYLSACLYFLVEKWLVNGLGARQCTDFSRFELLTVLSGKSEIRWEGGTSPLTAGETWLLPACLGKYMILSPAAESEIIRTYVPDIAAFDQEMAARGYSEEERHKFIFSK